MSPGTSCPSREGVATLTLNNPDERNTLTAPMVAEIIAAMDDIEADETDRRGRRHRRAAGVLRRRQPRQPGRGDGETSLGAIYEGFLRIARSPLPTLAAVNGAAVGAGMNLALGCDVRLAARRAKFDTRFLQIGIHPGGGHTWMLRRIAGPQAAMAAVVFGEVLDGAEAERVGLGVSLRRRRRPARRAPRRWPREPRRRPRELAIVTKRTIQAMADIADHPDAVEPRAGAAGLEHPAAVVRRAHRRPAGQIRSEVASTTVRECAHDCYASCSSSTVGVVSTVRPRSTNHPTPIHGRPARVTTEVLMSQRHRSRGAVRRRRWICGPTPTASATGSTPSCNAVAAQVSSGLEPDEVHEPGRAWEPEHHHDAERGQGAAASRPRHAPLEDEDVEAPHGAAPGEGRAPPPAPADSQRAEPCDSQRGGRVRLRRAAHSSTVIAVAHVVLPHAVDLEVAQGDALLADRQLLHHPAAVGVARDDADLQAVQVQSSKANRASTTTPSAT